MLTLSGPVGRDGENKTPNVRAVQQALKRLAWLHLDARLDPGFVDGRSGSGTEGAIEHFQRRSGSRRPDGRVDPGGYTARRMRAQLAIADDMEAGRIGFPFRQSSRWPYTGTGAGPRAFGSSRSGGARRHAGVDLYFAKGTLIYALADGAVIRPEYSFYARTNAVEIDHGTFVARYGEIDPGSARHLPAGTPVAKGDRVGNVGHLVGIRVPSDMLHIELYDKTETGALTRSSGTALRDGFTGGTFLRRRDLFDPTGILRRSPLAR